MKLAVWSLTAVVLALVVVVVVFIVTTQQAARDAEIAECREGVSPADIAFYLCDD